MKPVPGLTSSASGFFHVTVWWEEGTIEHLQHHAVVAHSRMLPVAVYVLSNPGENSEACRTHTVMLSQNTRLYSKTCQYLLSGKAVFPF